MKIILLYIFLSVLTVPCISQETIKNRTPFIIKTNLTKYITGETYISCEKFFSKIHPEIGFSIIYPFNPWLNAVSDNPLIRDDIYYFYNAKGLSFLLQNKFIVEQKADKSFGYIAPIFMFKSLLKENTDRKNIYASEIIVGYESLIKNLILIDFYTGFGWRVISLKQHYYTSNDISYHLTLHLGLSVGFNIFKK
jgi:hypothetical protein